MNMKKPALVGVLCLAIGFAAGYGTGRVSVRMPLHAAADQKGGYEAGYQAAVQKLEASGLVPKEPEQLTSLSGKISAIGQGSFTLEASDFVLNPLKPLSMPKQRTIRVTGDTKILTLIPATPEEIARQQEAFQKTLATREQAIPPSAFIEKPYVQTLKVGDMVRVEAAHDIKNAASFDALIVTVQNAQ